jgi:hypothetical protein
MQPKAFYCQHCGSSEGYASRAKHVVEKHVLRLLFLRPVRCGHCDRRYYRSVSVPVSERIAATAVDKSAYRSLTSGQNV